MTARLPKIVSPSLSAPGRRKRVREAMLAFEVYRHRAIRAVRLASLQAAAGSEEHRVWCDLLRGLRAADPWEL